MTESKTPARQTAQWWPSFAHWGVVPRLALAAIVIVAIWAAILVLL